MNLYHTGKDTDDYCQGLYNSVFGGNKYVKLIDRMISMIDRRDILYGIDVSATIPLLRERLRFFKNVCIPLFKFIQYVYYNRLQFEIENDSLQYVPTPYDPCFLFDFLQTLNPSASDYLLCMLSDDDTVKLKLRKVFCDNDKASFTSLLEKEKCNLSKVSIYLKQRDTFSIMSCDSFEMLSIFDDKLIPPLIGNNIYQLNRNESIGSSVGLNERKRSHYLECLYGFDEDNNIEKHFLNLIDVITAYEQKTVVEEWISDGVLWNQEENIYRQIIVKQSFKEITDFDKILGHIAEDKGNSRTKWLPVNFFNSDNDCNSKDEYLLGLKDYVIGMEEEKKEDGRNLKRFKNYSKFECFIDALANNNYFEDHPAYKLFFAQILTGKKACVICNMHWTGRVCDLYFLVKYMFDSRPDYNKADRLFNITDKDRVAKTEKDVKNKSAAADRPTSTLVEIINEYYPEIIHDYNKKHPRRTL